MHTPLKQIRTGPIRQDAAGPDCFCCDNEIIAALYKAAAELSLTDPESARRVVEVARELEK